MEICFKLCRWYYLLCLYEKVTYHTSAHACKHYDKIKILFVLTEMHITDIYAYYFKGSVQS